ncbi:Valine--tRNA ligase [Rhodovastum atsumiense]|uniref:Valine--tRNA ligase n=1 Tax=Rhodovastum atsumiense TaxID=504468 RepID=A0A5M6IK98_9PROT|nr:valine--tRNA ligase [Rhodovastum atsumiense]KAA5608686.1 valine--tRNA ligase [Rhodovastum atsumiense]CAH2599099.1 Valine--tRNA ligase [Rhodovastum atsumiense]
MLEKTHTPDTTEKRLYEGWEASGAFACDPGSNATPFAIMIPPPNVTGSLHMGHALTFTIQDTLIRWRRMQGRDVLWQPGTDHAGIATQMVVERLLAGQGSSRQALGREAFVERVWQWKAESGGTITRQLRRLGASLDWPRERFTMDEGLSAAVREVFVTLYRQGLIYRDRRLVNWDPKFQSAISDLEVESREVKGNLWHLTYPIEGEPGRFITVATTRPETMLGDTAVAVHPEDERFRDLVGKFAILPLVGRRIPIVADTYSDPEKGTGAVKITPAHDFNDFQVGQRHSVPMPSILDREARVTLAEIEDVLAAVPGIADPDFVRSLDGQDRFAARKAILEKLEELGLLVKTEPHLHQVPHGDRSGVPIEPRLTVQWYCNAAVLAKPAIEAVEQGRMRFVPQQWENTFFAWMRDIQPWCISRQLWWGHRIPAWYGPDGTVFVEKTEDEALAAARAHYGHDAALTRDEDVLDTWFSSALWPFSTLGWPEQTREVARYYPGDVLVTGFDIIFFWVARMMMMGLHFMGDVPFRHIYIHGLVRDERGQKMSKSKGNVIDPLELIDRYGADALRFTICALTGPGRDVKLGPSRVESYRSFVTKLWNAARFCEMNGVAPDPAFDPAKASLPLTRWILDAASSAIAEATTALEAYRFDEYAQAGYRFTWNTFCDWFVEFAKPVLANADSPEAAEVRSTAAHVLGLVLRLLHPAMPFVTEELWDRFGYGPDCSLIRTSWPTPFEVPGAAEARAELDWVVRLVSEVRAVRSEMNVPPSQRAPLLLKDAAPETLARGQRWIEAIGRLARAASLEALDGEVPHGSAQAVVGEATVVIPLAGLIDIAAESARLRKDRAKAAAEAEKIEKKLSNADFVARAPEEVVEENRERLQAARDEMARLDAALARIDG